MKVQFCRLTWQTSDAKKMLFICVIANLVCLKNVLLGLKIVFILSVLRICSLSWLTYCSNMPNFATSLTSNSKMNWHLVGGWFPIPQRCCCRWGCLGDSYCYITFYNFVYLGILGSLQSLRIFISSLHCLSLFYCFLECQVLNGQNSSLSTFWL